VGGGFAGLYALRRLERLLPADVADLVLVSPTDHLVYSPLLPDVTASTLEPRHVAVALRQVLPRTRLVLGQARSADRARHTVEVAPSERGRSGPAAVLPWDRLLLAPGSVTREFPIPGMSEQAHGVKTLTEAVFVRDHLLTQLDIADSLPDEPAFAAERRERMTVVAVGAGYTGTEVVAQTHRWLSRIASRWTHLAVSDVRWVLVDKAPTVLPEMGARLGAYAMEVLRRRGIDVRLGVSVAAVDGHTITLTDGTAVPARTLLWSAGVCASPLVATLGLPLAQDRLLTDAQMRADEHIRQSVTRPRSPIWRGTLRPGRRHPSRHRPHSTRNGRATSRPTTSRRASGEVAPGSTGTRTWGSWPTSAGVTRSRSRSASSSPASRPRWWPAATTCWPCRAHPRGRGSPPTCSSTPCFPRSRRVWRSSAPRMP
jgi:NADH dehydrogenase FAD-containing subunit